MLAGRREGPLSLADPAGSRKTCVVVESLQAEEPGDGTFWRAVSSPAWIPLTFFGSGNNGVVGALTHRVQDVGREGRAVNLRISDVPICVTDPVHILKANRWG
jgi:hypothetical protein